MPQPTPNSSPTRRISAFTGTLLVVASMVGTGVFTTTGFLVRDLGSPGAVLVAWGFGGVLAAAGALAYAELSAALPDNGGEYYLLGRIYHPAVGFVAGWVSFVVGFSAPMAAAAVAFGQYAHNLLPAVPPRALALGLVVSLGLVHLTKLAWSSWVQNVATLLDVVLILAFVLGAARHSERLSLAEPERSIDAAVLSSDFAVALVYISFAYSGWNAAVYVAGEVRDPARSLPRCLVWGTCTVVVLYLALNSVFVSAAPLAALSGVLDVGNVAAAHLFGESAARLVSALVAVGLFTTVSALLMTGPRVYEAMGRDYPRLAWLSPARGKNHAPARSVLLQVVVAVLMVLSMTFDLLIATIGLCLMLSSALTIIGVFVLRVRAPDLARPYRTWGYPVTLVAPLVLTMWACVHAAWQRPVAALVSVATLTLGYGLYWWARRP